MLPDFAQPINEEIAMTDRDQELDDSLESCPPECRPRGFLEQWREHPNCAIGMRVVELSTIWLAHGWQTEVFSMFTWWLSQLGLDVVGNLNHTKRWLTGFQASLIQACQVGTASSLHAVLPATGMPSFFIPHHRCGLHRQSKSPTGYPHLHNRRREVVVVPS